VWLQSITTLLAVIDDVDTQLGVLECELRPVALADERVKLLMTIRGSGELLGLTIASEIGDIAASRSRKLVGYFGLTPAINQSGQNSRTGRLSNGPDTLRWPPSRPPSRRGAQTTRGTASHRPEAPATARASNAAKVAVARKVLIAAWHVLSRRELFKPSAAAHARHRPVPASSPFVWLNVAHKRCGKPGPAATRPRAPTQAPNEISTPHCRTPPTRAPAGASRLTSPHAFKETNGSSAGGYISQKPMAILDDAVSEKDLSLDHDEDVELIAA
jgi:hypothetical protein